MIYTDLQCMRWNRQTFFFCIWTFAATAGLPPTQRKEATNISVPPDMAGLTTLVLENDCVIPPEDLQCVFRCVSPRRIHVKQYRADRAGTPHTGPLSSGSPRAHLPIFVSVFIHFLFLISYWFVWTKNRKTNMFCVMMRVTNRAIKSVNCDVTCGQIFITKLAVISDQVRL